MKLSPARALAIASIAALLAATPSQAQTPNPSPTTQSGQDQSAPQPAEPKGKVLFQRSLGPDGDTVSAIRCGRQAQCAILRSFVI